MIHIISDFSRHEDYPLVNSKFAVYICTYVDADRTIRDMPLLKALKPYALRYDPGCGFGNDDKLNSPREYNAPQIERENGRIKINFQDYDRMVSQLQDSNVKMMYVNAYNPICLQDETAELEGNMDLGMRSRWNTMPNDLEAWQEINRLYAEHFKSVDHNSKYYEIWNEPDLKPIFFTGTMEEYFEIYRHGALGVQKGDPNAKIGGPVISNTAVNDPTVTDAADWAEEFLNFVEKNHLPLHFFSYHNYASPRDIVPIMRDAIRNRPGMECVDTILSEYNSYRPGTRDFTVGGEIERHHLAYRLLDDFKYFVEQPDISCVYWAQFNDPEVFGDYVDRCGLLSIDGIEKAAYHAYKIYSEMPADRVQLTIDNPQIDGMASFNADKACIVLWNKDKQVAEVRIQIRNLPFSSGNCTVYKIDAWRNSRIDNMNETSFHACDQFAFDQNQSVVLDELMGESVYYLELTGADVHKEQAAVPYDIQRYYYDRYKSNYAEYDADEAAVYLGMGHENEAISKLTLQFNQDITGFELIGRGLPDHAPGIVTVSCRKSYSDGNLLEEQFHFSASQMRSGVEVGFSIQAGAVHTEITCTMKNMPPHAQAKIQLRVND